MESKNLVNNWARDRRRPAAVAAIFTLQILFGGIFLPLQAWGVCTLFVPGPIEELNHMTVCKKSGPFWAGNQTKAETPIKVMSR